MKCSELLLVAAVCLLFVTGAFAKNKAAMPNVAKTSSTAVVTYLNVRVLNVDKKNVLLAYHGEQNAQTVVIENINKYEKRLKKMNEMDLDMKPVGTGWKIVNIKESSPLPFLKTSDFAFLK